MIVNKEHMTSPVSQIFFPEQNTLLILASPLKQQF